jgi:serine/threonine protein phosphatase PrpC
VHAEAFAASARGPVHAGLGVGNQDAWRVSATSRGTVVAIADGLGSKPSAARGAHAACAAAIAATAVWWQRRDTPAAALGGLIESRWRARLGPVPPDEARTTCLLAALDAQDRLVIATLGDGLALVADDHGAELITEERPGFGNETSALGAIPSDGAWRVAVRSMTPGTVVLLATDGVSDDLVAERRADFAREVVASFGSLSPWQRSPELWRALHAWPTPGHGDDKTVAVLWRPR